MKIRHHPFDSNMLLDENALLQIKIILAKTCGVVKPDLENALLVSFIVTISCLSSNTVYQ